MKQDHRPIPWQRWLVAAALSASTAGVAHALVSAPPPSISLACLLAVTQGKEEVNGRVTTFIEGTGIVIDRGLRDGVAVGDRVIFTERGGQQQYGTVVELEGRGATVRPEDPAYRPQPGTRAAITVPASRFEEAPEAAGDPRPRGKVPAQPSGELPSPDALGPKGSDSGRWTRPEDGFTIDMPLLAEVNAVKPSKRASSLTGRSYLAFDQIFDTEDDREDHFARLGGAVYGENLFGRGGTLHFDGEFNARGTQLPDDDDESESDFRLDRLSYTLGGDRHNWQRVQFGRFLNYDMPEFGVLDGASIGRRTESGDSYGASVGFLPEPDKDQQSLEDFQLAAWYRWVPDEREILSLTAGYQKTWHNGTRDRDLVVLKSQYIPTEGWNVFGTAWIDIYGVNDQIKDSGPALTYMILDARRRFENELDLSFDYRHQEYPELRRNEFAPVGPLQIQDAHVNRLGGTLSKWTSGGQGSHRAKRMYLRLGGWADEDDTGGDAEVGVDLMDVFADDARLDLAIFTSQAKFTGLVGARMRFGRYGPKRSWSVSYEIRQNDVIGFENDVDELYQHRARGSYELFRTSGLSASITGELQLQDREDQLFLGLFFQRSF